VRGAADRARQGDGPYLIEAMTYRMGAHTTSDDPTRYRLESELQAWSAKDPIARYRTWLKGQGILDDAAASAIESEAESSARSIRSRLLSIAPSPPGDAIFGRVYAEPPDSFVEERQEFESSLEGQ
jgi:2-oxoisovalerate dehydrogenase E1 component alpha subunit